jgi:hypothetical protein
MPALPDEAAPSPKVIPSAPTTPTESADHANREPTRATVPNGQAQPGGSYSAWVCIDDAKVHVTHGGVDNAWGPAPARSQRLGIALLAATGSAMASTARSEMSEERIGIGLHGHNSSSRRTLSLRSLGST